MTAAVNGVRPVASAARLAQKTEVARVEIGARADAPNSAAVDRAENAVVVVRAALAVQKAKKVTRPLLLRLSKFRAKLRGDRSAEAEHIDLLETEGPLYAHALGEWYQTQSSLLEPQRRADAATKATNIVVRSGGKGIHDIRTIAHGKSMRR